MRGLLLSMACLALPVAAIGQTATTIRTGVQIVVVDVNVIDAHGNPVHNLKQSDFSVLENGHPQAINRFEEHSAPTAAELVRDPLDAEARTECLHQLHARSGKRAGEP
jgi:VWFA-related protein